jgi:hypothetical protein
MNVSSDNLIQQQGQNPVITVFSGHIDHAPDVIHQDLLIPTDEHH